MPLSITPRRLGAALATTLVLAACASGPDPAEDTPRATTPDTARATVPVPTPVRSSGDGPVAVRRLRAEPYAFTHSSGFRDSARVIARDDATWARAWEKVYERHGEVPPRPAVSFAESMVVVVALGERNTGGYGILVDGAERVRDTLAITVRRVSPGPRCGTTAALSQPVDIAVLPRLTLPVRWVEKAEVTQCP